MAKSQRVETGDVVEMIRQSFGEEIAKKAAELRMTPAGEALSLLQLVELAERAVLEEEAWTFQEFEQLQTNSRLIEEREE